MTLALGPFSSPDQSTPDGGTDGRKRRARPSSVAALPARSLHVLLRRTLPTPTPGVQMSKNRPSTVQVNESERERGRDGEGGEREANPNQ